MRNKNQRIIVFILALLSVLIYGIQIMLFHDPKTTGFYFLQDMAFMPLTVLIATILIGSLLQRYERKEMIERTRLLTSTFFTEVGEDLLQPLILSASCYDEVVELLKSKAYSEKEVKQRIRDMHLKVRLTPELIQSIKNLLEEHQMFMTITASNPILLEHEKYTDMLWALFHLKDEIRMRGTENLSEESMQHLELDSKRVLELLLLNWVDHTRYVKKEYPYFYASKYKHIDFYKFFDKI